jgi:hypothetical protein
MNVEVIVRVDGREVACVQQTLETDTALHLEEQNERLKDRVGRTLLEVGFGELARQARRPCCCGRPMHNKGRRCVSVISQSGPVVLERNRYRCRECGCWQTPADALVCCGNHRVTRYLARQVCQLATVEHFTRLEQLLADQHGVRLSHDPLRRLVEDVGLTAESERLADATAWREQSAPRRWPPPECTPRRVYVSCDGIMDCTNQTEPDPRHPDQQRLIWKQMRVGCVDWQDDRERWHKRVIWGQEEDFQSFGAALYRLACRCGYRQARERIFAADGGEWCWTIHQTYFADAAGVLDWYHASEHVWSCGQQLCGEDAAAWVHGALGLLRHQGGVGLLRWLLHQHKRLRGRKRRAVGELINYIQPRLDRTSYPQYRNAGWQIGTGMIESTAKQLVGLRLKGPGMHWSADGATAVTALRAQDFNGRWHSFWNNLAIAT